MSQILIWAERHGVRLPFTALNPIGHDLGSADIGALIQHVLHDDIRDTTVALQAQQAYPDDSIQDCTTFLYLIVRQQLGGNLIEGLQRLAARLQVDLPAGWTVQPGAVHYPVVDDRDNHYILPEDPNNTIGRFTNFYVLGLGFTSA